MYQAWKQLVLDFIIQLFDNRLFLMRWRSAIQSFFQVVSNKVTKFIKLQITLSKHNSLKYLKKKPWDINDPLLKQKSVNKEGGLGREKVAK